MVGGDANITNDVDGKRYDENRSSPVGIGEGAKYDRRQSLEDDIESQSEVDGLGRNVELLTEEGKKREVDCCGEWRCSGSNAENQLETV